MVNKLNKDFYNSVLAQAFSPCGHFLIAGDIYGNLSIFNLAKVIKSEGTVTKEELLPKSKITVCPDLQINSLLATENHLLVGGYGEIYAYSWKTIKGSNRNVKPTWSIEIPSDQDELNRAEVNSLLFEESSANIYAGCGDNKIYIFNLESRKPIKTLTGHTDYVHSICKNGNNNILSGGEDGLVNIWDLRINKAVEKLIPHQNSQIARHNLGKWIGAVDSNEDYIVCGGGPRLSLFHSRFLSNSTIFPIDDQGIHVTEIQDDKVFAGGRSKLFYQASFNGSIITEIPTSGATVYSAVRQETPFKIMAIAGSSPKIDISLNFMYKDQQLSLY
ncbi:THO complex subunit 6 [Anthonomus grandis grandis]|uniref:THO complex subunit 6 n=1 Tax=Anthonomus grandis grandis TaxID=2921223 RepID=UPI00216693F8|nr:THO complex subunit 6 [Anthonomus grandis grandis]